MLILGLVILYIFILLMLRNSYNRRFYSNKGGSHLLGPAGTQHMYYAYEGFANTADATFTMFGVDWCPHCVAAKPIFESLGSTMTIGGKTVALTVVNPEQDKAAAAGYELDGYPTFYFEMGGQRQKYDGPRTKDGFQQFLQKQMA